MNRNVLIDQAVRQATVLVAHLATQGGARAPLSDVADQVFRSLVAELDAQAVGQKVIADMFGLALRTYYARVQRLGESRTMRGRSLWEAVLSHIGERGPLARDAIMRRFAADDEQVLRAILRDLVDEGLLATSRGAKATYRVARAAEAAVQPAAVDGMVWVAVFHAGQTTAAAVAEGLRLELGAVEAAIARLEAQQRVTRAAGGLVRADTCVIAADDDAGWEGAVFDHLQAVTGALCHKLARLGRAGAADPGDQALDQAIGGSTYTFDLSPENPTWDRVLALLARFRKELSDLRAEADAFEVATSARQRTRFVFYVGANVHADRLPARRAERRAEPRRKPTR
ncbi:MAG: hypothetical protein U1F43_27490 [Myxococcota bacterium]